jgi:hypothetical protein
MMQGEPSQIQESSCPNCEYSTRSTKLVDGLEKAGMSSWKLARERYRRLRQTFELGAIEAMEIAQIRSARKSA